MTSFKRAVGWVGLFFLLGLGTPAWAAPGTFKVGLLTPMTGPNPDWGKKQTLAMEMAVEKVNQRGGVYGTQVEMVALDTGGNPQTALEAYQKLANSDRVLAVVGPLMSSTFLALQPATNQEKVCIIATASAKPGLSNLQKYPYAFRMTVTSDKAEGASAKSWAKAHDIKTVVILYEREDPYCAPIGEKLWPKTFKDLSIKVLNENHLIVLNRGQTDFDAALNDVKRYKPDGVCIAAMPPETARLLKAMRGQSLNQPVLGSGSVATETVINMAGKDAEGLYSYTLFNPNDPNPKVAKYTTAFQKRCKETYTDVGCESDQFDVVVYDILQFLVNVMKKVHVSGDPGQLTADRQKIRYGLADMKMWRGTAGMMAFDKKGDGIRTIHIMEIKDGKWQRIY